ncbi:MAG TPA: TIGR03013 family XrtA/PEP-CTERM system glycosyltransferase, partial [Casimicrobiaceae bacterium]|nr:TIGR03013 family XrtA/PEP-CTERM system glycosyltransferase [Casimicrobiaceae bacterium]
LFQLAVELSWVFIAILLVIRLDAGVQHSDVALIAFVFAATIICLNGAFGLYRRSQTLSTGAYIVRVILAPAVGIPLAFLGAQLLPGPVAADDKWLLAITLALVGLLLVRHVVVLPLVGTLLPHRILVLGTGPEARLVEASLTATQPLGMRLVGFYALESPQEAVVSPARIVARAGPLEEVVRQLGINEIIIAVRQQRGGVLPLRGLLDCRLNGVQITDLARYFERVHNQVPIESLKVSWLIYGQGFRQNVVRAIVKRSFDLVVSAVLIVLTAPIVVLSALLIAAEGGGPVIFRQQRVGHRGRSFTVFKLRSMQQDAERDGKATWATVNDVRVTRVGRLIRRARIDELPQLFNVLRGEMSFVGPRPERPEFVAMLTEQIPFYAVRHSVKPGLTGWAQVRYSYGATVEQSVRKLEYDLYYVKNHTLLLDLVILLETVRVVLLGEGAR